MSFTVIIPARYASTRFPAKPLANIKGKAMINHVIDRAFEAKANQVIVATDDQRIADIVSSQAQICMTSSTHNSGTERLAEVIDTMQIPADTTVVNVQGDEPFIPPQNILQVAENLTSSGASMATLSTPIHDLEEVVNPNSVKVVADVNGYAMYFSRSTIPLERDVALQGKKHDLTLYQRHIGLYAYKASYIKQYVSYETTLLEQVESLEQLRALWYGDKIHIEQAIAPPPIGIDTPEDLELLLKTLNA